MLVDPLRRPNADPPSRATLLAGTGVSVALAVALLVAAAGGEPARGANVFWEDRVETEPARAASVAYVGYDPATFDASRGYDPQRIEDAADRWAERHWTDTVTRVDPVTLDGRVVGVRIVFEARDALPPRTLPDDLDPDAPQIARLSSLDLGA